MKTNVIILITIGIFINSLEAQNVERLFIKKIKGSYQKEITLPTSLRVLTINESIHIFSLDSIRNEYFYGNLGKDSIAISSIEAINLRGIKEFIKYSAITFCGLVSTGAGVFTIVAINGPIYKCEVNCNNDINKFIGMGYLTAFGSLGTFIFHYPRTRFKPKKYTFTSTAVQNIRPRQ
ncbi:MAG: hypothetical protein Q8R57_08600 [Bacteroidota bacterium]|nr:hypothetical protein [Bacteroidota bacterium]